MTYLVRVGFIPGNRSKTGARGYCVRRAGKVVTVLWGGIEVRKWGSQTHYYWAAGYPQQKSHTQPSVKAAIGYKQSIIRKKGYAPSRYERLPAGTRIRGGR
jgi:hypothetical protein